MSRRYFGTDGIRGAVGVEPITVDFVLKLGYAAGRVLAGQRSVGRPRVVIGKDTRVSGYLFESALEAGLLAAGCDVQLLGPMPTPGVAHLTQALRADAGIVVSASHNPYSDNGIKFFDQAGRKLDDAVELAIEAALAEPLVTLASERLGRAERVPEAHGRYIEFCTAAFPADLDLRGLKLVLDCAHGATYRTAPRVFAELGAEIRAIGVQPDGFNINDGVGSTHPQALVAAVAEHQADLGIAFDGDGDRVLMVDRDGQVRDGDELLYLLACDWHARGTLRGPVVGTLMTNGALERALGLRGMALVRAKVGDRHVLEQLLAHGANLGGEASGHLLLLDASNTGDAVIAALNVLAVLRRQRTDLASALAGLDKWPQVMINVRVNARPDLSAPPIRAAVAAAEQALNGRGRLVLRPSGTEPLIRVMVEADDHGLASAQAERVADSVRGTSL